MLSRNEILAANDLPHEAVDVPEWGGTVFVRTMTGEERDRFENEAIAVQVKGKREINLTNVRAKLAVLTVCDEGGGRLFTDADAPLLGRKSARALNRVYDVAARLNGLSASDVEELAGN